MGQRIGVVNYMFAEKDLEKAARKLADTFKELGMADVVFIGRAKGAGLVRICSNDGVDVDPEKLMDLVFEVIDKISRRTSIPRREIIKYLLWHDFLADSIKSIEKLEMEVEQDDKETGAGEEKN